MIEALQALRGVAQMTAATIVCELGSLSRFESPRQLMVTADWCRENIPAVTAFTAARHQDCNAHLRRVLVEAAWPTSIGPMSPTSSQKAKIIGSQ